MGHYGPMMNERRPGGDNRGPMHRQGGGLPPDHHNPMHEGQRHKNRGSLRVYQFKLFIDFSKIKPFEMVEIILDIYKMFAFVSFINAFVDLIIKPIKILIIQNSFIIGF